MADVTNATWARKTKAMKRQLKRNNETDDVVFAGRNFSKIDFELSKLCCQCMC